MTDRFISPDELDAILLVCIRHGISKIEMDGLMVEFRHTSGSGIPNMRTIIDPSFLNTAPPVELTEEEKKAAEDALLFHSAP